MPLPDRTGLLGEARFEQEAVGLLFIIQFIKLFIINYQSQNNNSGTNQ